MEDLITNLISSIIGGADNIINSVFNNLIDTCFNMENHLTTLFGTQWLDFSGLKTVILSFSISLIILKFLKKGFDTYILWTEGDIDTPSLTFITYFIRAVVMAISFPILYDWLITASKGLATDVLNSLNISAQQEIINALVHGSSLGIFGAIFAIIILIILFLLYIQFLMRGVEMFVLKLGFPLACIGLVDSDKGVFAPYIKKYFQSILTVIIQIALVKIAIMLIITNQYIDATALLLVAMRTPKFLQEFLITATNGGAVNNAIHTTSKTIELTKQISLIAGRGK